jgi:glycosyltransferase involved in cell wall biosynthesis
VHHRPKGARPERWLAALDLFLYAARYEEFGMVVAEAQAMGVPVLTSRLVGASECLPQVYAPWLLERPDAAELAARALALLADPRTRRELGAAGAASVAAYDERAYMARTLDLIAAQKRRVQ